MKKKIILALFAFSSNVMFKSEKTNSQKRLYQKPFINRWKSSSFKDIYKNIKEKL
jgi:hypothetical protein